MNELYVRVGYRSLVAGDYKLAGYMYYSLISRYGMGIGFQNQYSINVRIKYEIRQYEQND